LCTRLGGAFGGAAFFFDDGFRIDQPLTVDGLFLFFIQEAARAEPAADLGAGGVHCDRHCWLSTSGPDVRPFVLFPRRAGTFTLAVVCRFFDRREKESDEKKEERK
jgi:hypothetical protein